MRGSSERTNEDSGRSICFVWRPARCDAQTREGVSPYVMVEITWEHGRRESGGRRDKDVVKRFGAVIHSVILRDCDTVEV